MAKEGSCQVIEDTDFSEAWKTLQMRHKRKLKYALEEEEAREKRTKKEAIPVLAQQPQVGPRADMETVLRLQNTIKELRAELGRTKKREKRAKQKAEKKPEEAPAPAPAVYRKSYNDITSSGARKERFRRFGLFVNDLCQTETPEVIDRFLHDYKVFRGGYVHPVAESLITAEQTVEFMRTFQVSWNKLGRMRKMFMDVSSNSVFPSFRQIRKFISKPEQPAPSQDGDHLPNTSHSSESISRDEEMETADETYETEHALLKDQYPFSYSQEGDPNNGQETVDQSDDDSEPDEIEDESKLGNGSKTKRGSEHLEI